MLRGIRFASTFNFELELETLAAIQKHAPEIRVVSGERIGAEMRRMLRGIHRASATSLLRKSGLLAEILAEGEMLYVDESRWTRTVRALERLKPGEFESAAMILLEPIIQNQGFEDVMKRWKLSNDERKSIVWIFRNWKKLDRANELLWSEVQPLLLAKDAERALAVAQSRSDGPSAGVGFCRVRLDGPRAELDPEPFLDGKDLIEMGIKPGPMFKSILDSVRAAQLDGEIVNVEEAEQKARQQSVG